MSIAFNVNDNLSISYSEVEDTYDSQDDASTAVEDQTMKTESLQLHTQWGLCQLKHTLLRLLTLTTIQTRQNKT